MDNRETSRKLKLEIKNGTNPTEITFLGNLKKNWNLTKDTKSTS